jgi:hypothetical protein
MYLSEVSQLLDYWAEYPPEHLLLRAMAHYEGRKDRGNWRKERAKEMRDESYVEPVEKSVLASSSDRQAAMEAFTGGRHLDCAPTHLQEAVARAKRGEQFNIPKPE